MNFIVKLRYIYIYNLPYYNPFKTKSQALNEKNLDFLSKFLICYILYSLVIVPVGT